MIAGAALCAPACGSDSNVAKYCPSNPQRLATSPSLTAQQFCQVYLQTCVGSSNPPGGYTTLADCETAFPNLTFETTRQCRSYHLCNAASYDSAEVVLHCRHTMGLGLCADTLSGM
jgi:hypothetical protein